MKTPFGDCKIINLYGTPVYVKQDASDEELSSAKENIRTQLLELEAKAPEIYEEAKNKNYGTRKKLSIYAIQMCSKIGDKQANLEKVQKLVERDIKADTDIIVLPEVWTVGWSPKHFTDSAEDINNSKTIDFLSQIAKNTKPG